MTAPSTTSDPTPSSIPPGTTSPVATEFRFGPESEEWMRGKTPAEVTQIARQLAELAQRAVTQPQYQPPPQQMPAQEPSIGPDDYVTGKTVQDFGARFMNQAQQYAQQAVNPAIEMAASNNLDRIKGEFSKEFAKYGPEIFGYLSKVPKTDWSIDNLRRVVNLTRADHLDELANERAAQLAAQDPALRSSGAAGAPIPAVSAPTTGLTDTQKDHLRRRGITPEMVADFCAKKGDGTTPQKWYEQFGKLAIGDA